MQRKFIGLWFIGALAGCTSSPPACGDGFCEARAGESCSSCPGDCGACTTTCGPTNCAGCCDGDACVGGNAPSGCGSGGDVCTVCEPSFLCSAGACEVDPASRWNVVLEQLTVNTQTTAGDAWDAFGGAPDPFVEVRVGSSSATPSRSGVANDTFAVNFSGGATASNVRADAIQAYIAFTAWDEDTTSDDRIGSCFSGNPDPAFGGESQTLTCSRDTSGGQAGFTLNWHLDRF